MRKLLAVEPLLSLEKPFALLPIEHWTPNWSPGDAQLLCSLLSAYRLHDLMVLLSGFSGLALPVPKTPLQVGEQVFVVRLSCFII